MKRYPGGKNAEGTWQQIVGRMPPHTYYGELAVGSGGILKRKVPALRSFVCDLDPTVIDYWKRLEFPGVTALNTCGIEWARDHAELMNDDWLIYWDPPYPRKTRSYAGAMYRFEMTDGDHRRLLDVASRLPCRVMISSYDSPLYRRALRGWSHAQWQAVCRNGSLRTEHLWCNLEPAHALDVCQKTPGRDFRERERIKRRLKRWRSKYDAMPDYERRAVLAELVRAEQRRGLEEPSPETMMVDARRKRR